MADIEEVAVADVEKIVVAEGKKAKKKEVKVEAVPLTEQEIMVGTYEEFVIGYKEGNRDNRSINSSWCYINGIQFIWTKRYRDQCSTGRLYLTTKT